MEENVINKVDELVNSIKESSTYKRYIIVKEALSKNKDIMTKIDRVKMLQKRIVNLENSSKDYSEENNEINAIIKELNEYPIYTEYEELVDKLNYENKYIKDAIELYIDSIIN